MSSPPIPPPPPASSRTLTHSEYQRQKSPPQRQPHHLHSSPKPLSRQIDPWIYTSLALSLSSLLLLRYTHSSPSPTTTSPFAQTALGRNDTAHLARSSTAPLSASLGLGLGSGFGSGLGLDALLLVILFYGTILLLLSSKERQLFHLHETAVPKPLTPVRLVDPTSRGTECEKHRVDESMSVNEDKDENEGGDGDEDAARIEDSRRSLVIWMLAVCQSGLAAVGLYTAARVVVVLRGFAESRCLVFECLGLVYAVGEMGMLVYVALCCVVQASGRCGSGLRRTEEANGFRGS